MMNCRPLRLVSPTSWTDGDGMGWDGAGTGTGEIKSEDTER